MSSELLTCSAIEIGRKIRAGVVTSQNAVEIHIDAIEERNPAINAVVATRFDEARAEAKGADAALAAGTASDSPLFGVPITVKEAFALEGMPHTSGLVARKGVLATEDATAVRRLRAAGAIPLGVTNTSELCMWMESDNRVYGRTNNPYDAQRIAGGSSGGEGAIVGAGASPVGLGADIGGSIRMPAFFCGVFGHKPTGGLVPGTGQFPIAENDALRLLSTGPIARRAEDLEPFLRIIAGPDGVDSRCVEMPIGDPSAVTLEGLPVLDVRDNDLIPVSGALRAAQARVGALLRKHGAKVRRARVRELRRSLQIWTVRMDSAATTSYATHLGSGTPVRPGRELVRLLMGRSPYTLPSLGLAAIEKLPILRGAGAKRMLAAGETLRDKLEGLIGDGVMLFPSYPQVAPRHKRPILTPVLWMYTGIINALEMPATQVPLGLDDRGLPLGVQVVGRRGNDHVTIAVAMELEKLFGGWRPPARTNGNGGTRP